MFLKKLFLGKLTLFFFFFFLFIWWQSRIFRSCAEVIFLWKRWSFFRIRWWTQSQKKAYIWTKSLF